MKKCQKISDTQNNTKDLYKKQQEKIERVFADVKGMYVCGLQGTEAGPKQQNR